MDQFKNIRGDLFTNGIVIKEFLSLAKTDNITNEYRAFYLYGNLITLSKNSNQSTCAKQIPYDFIRSIPKLSSNFYTIDFAELEDGSWFVIETGDGQVSGLSPNQYIFKFYEEIGLVFKHTK